MKLLIKIEEIGQIHFFIPIFFFEEYLGESESVMNLTNPLALSFVQLLPNSLVKPFALRYIAKKIDILSRVVI